MTGHDDSGIKAARRAEAKSCPCQASLLENPTSRGPGAPRWRRYPAAIPENGASATRIREAVADVFPAVWYYLCSYQDFYRKNRRLPEGSEPLPTPQGPSALRRRQKSGALPFFAVDATRGRGTAGTGAKERRLLSRMGQHQGRARRKKPDSRAEQTCGDGKRRAAAGREEAGRAAARNSVPFATPAPSKPQVAKRRPR